MEQEHKKITVNDALRAWDRHADGNLYLNKESFERIEQNLNEGRRIDRRLDDLGLKRKVEYKLER